MKIQKDDLFAPANAITIVGLLLTLYGASSLHTVSGVLIAALGRSLDLIDGPIARKFHSSRLGAVLDGTADKLATFGLLLAAFLHETAPVAVIAYIFLQNLLIAGIVTYADRTGREPSTSILGKRSMFIQNATLLWFSLLNAAEIPAENYVEIVLYVLFILAIPLGIAATAGYIRHAFLKSSK